MPKIKASADIVRREGFIGVGQRAMRGEAPIMSRFMARRAPSTPSAPTPPAPPTSSSELGNPKLIPTSEVESRKKKEAPISIVA